MVSAKIQSLHDRAAKKESKVLDVPVPELYDNAEKECTNCVDLEKLMRELKIKCACHLHIRTKLSYLH